MFVTFLIAVAISFVGARAASAQWCVEASPHASYFEGPIGLVSADPVLEPVVLEAIDHWGSCTNYGVGFPGFVVGADAHYLLEVVGASRTVEIVLDPGAGEQGKCAGFRARTIRLFKRALTPSGELLSCGSLARNLAHELGHVLGLRDARNGRRCQGHIMALVSSRASVERIVSPEECTLAGAHAIGRHELRALMIALGGAGGERREGSAPDPTSAAAPSREQE